MSQESVDVVLAQHDAMNRGDLAGAASFLAPDVVLVISQGLAPDAGTFNGSSDTRRWYQRWFSTFADDYSFEILETIDGGDRVVVMANHRGTGRASGAPVEMFTATVFWVRAGQIRRVESHRSKAAALEAAGLSE